MNLGEALTVKAKELGIKHFGEEGHHTGGPQVNATDEEIREMIREGYSRYQICKRKKVGIDRVRRLFQEAER